jgi:UDP-N-acetyl-2-amino-2-deoxyglucuronate dehydrogenase
MKNGKIGFGLIGAGMAGRIHARELAFVKDAELVAVCCKEPVEQIKEFAREFGAKRWYTDYRELLTDEEVDVVNVNVPTGRHAEITIAASGAGKHILVEKPLEANLARADEMIRVCRENRTKLGVIFQMRFGSVAAKLKRAVDSGALGRIFLADAVDKSSRTAAYYALAEWRRSKELGGGGCLMTQSIHIVDLLQHIVGPVKSVVGKVGTKIHAIEVEDTATALISFQNGAMGIIESTSSIKPALKSRIELHGERGTIVANAQYDQILFWDVDGHNDGVEIEKHITLGDIDDPWAYPQTRHRHQLRDMVEAIRENRDPILTGEDARISLAINMAIYESSRTGREIDFTQPPYTLPAAPAVAGAASVVR